jgi:hypothetical protein
MPLSAGTAAVSRAHTRMRRRDTAMESLERMHLIPMLLFERAHLRSVLACKLSLLQDLIARGGLLLLRAFLLEPIQLGVMAVFKILHLRGVRALDSLPVATAGRFVIGGFCTFDFERPEPLVVLPLERL